MIFDCFTFFNELDLLEIRLNVLKDVVDKFVLVEATKTHTGKDKPLYYEENKARYAAFADRIIHVVVDDFSSAEGLTAAREKAWACENIQRNAIARGLVGARPDDIVLISDLDEIPDPVKIPECVRNLKTAIRFEQRNYCYYLNMRSYPCRMIRAGTAMISFGRMHEPGICNLVDRRYAENVVQSVNEGNTITRIRRCLKDEVLVRDAGWHFTYLGGEEKVAEKLRCIAEGFRSLGQNELLAYARQRIERGEDVLQRFGRMFAERLEDGFPEYVVSNRERFGKYVYPVDEAYLRRVRMSRLYYFFSGALRDSMMACVPAFLVAPLSRLVRRMRAIAQHMKGVGL